ncbi:hypothetical protein BE08_37400 [Sorangium cellulosum]|uniref:Secreted protein n=1 Tax=Sorangium cellulosum TaxID=56 RepID=A0A150PC28_SORCE|nr:hypothetical protein BE08_37400 [Sorangium cellulosum]
MTLFSKRILPLTLLGAAAVLGGCVGGASLEGDDEQETQTEAEAAVPGSADAIDPDAAEAIGTAQQALESTWNCIKFWEADRPGYVGQVTIWWGHSYWDAQWACNNWIGTCQGLCYAERPR